PIINEKEVGGLHVVNLLGFRPEQYTATDFDIDEFSRALSQESSTKTRVLVADEVTCLQVRSLLQKQRLNAELVFPPEADEGSGGEFAGLMPRYRLGFFVSREHRRLID